MCCLVFFRVFICASSYFCLFINDDLEMMIKIKYSSFGQMELNPQWEFLLCIIIENIMHFIVPEGKFVFINQINIKTP